VLSNVPKVPLSKKEVQISKALSSALRHNRMGFKVDEEGFLKVEDILKHNHFRNKLNATKEIIHRVVDLNDKNRYEIKLVGGEEKIRASQGHSVEVKDLGLKEIQNSDEYPVVVHGTYRKFWKNISSQGLHRRNRNHVHMTTASKLDVGYDLVISGMRRSCDVFVYIDIKEAMRDGLKFFVSTNNVILSPGNNRGFILPKYFKEVIWSDKK